MALLGLVMFSCIPPKSVRIDHETDSHRHCVDYRIPTDWQFPDHGPVREYSQDTAFGFHLRQLGARYLLRGLRQREGHAPELSYDSYALAYQQDVMQASEEDWSAARTVFPYRAEVSDFPSKSAPLGDPYRSPREFLRGPKLLSPSGKKLLRIHYEHGYGPLTPSTSASLEVFHLATGKRLWAASGPAPQVPPVDLFASVAWLDDETILWPRNQLGTHLTVCWQIPD